MRYLKKTNSVDVRVLVPLIVVMLGAIVVSRAYFFPQLTKAFPVQEGEVRIANDFDVVLIPVAPKEIAEGETLNGIEFVRIKWPKQYLLGSFVTELSELTSKRAALRIAAFSPIPKSAVTSKAHGQNSVIQQIPEGMRAVGIRVDSESAVEGWARPGSRVDVIVLYEQTTESKKVAAKVIAENIVVLSAGGAKHGEIASSLSTSARIPKTVTLLVSQRDALEIKTASSMGRLTLSLRGASDVIPTKDLKMNQAGLIGETVLSSKTSSPFRGYAKGPDGERYILDSRDRWVGSRSKSKVSIQGRL